MEHALALDTIFLSYSQLYLVGKEKRGDLSHTKMRVHLTAGEAWGHPSFLPQDPASLHRDFRDIPKVDKAAQPSD